MSERDRIQGEYLAALDVGEGIVDVGDTVLCDGCSTDLTNDSRSGGLLFGSYAYGPCCADDMMSKIHRYGEESYIRAHCPDDMSYADWVRQLRGGNTQIRVTPTDIGSWS